jgi:hypothetical protein
MIAGSIASVTREALGRGANVRLSRLTGQHSR